MAVGQPLDVVFYVNVQGGYSDSTLVRVDSSRLPTTGATIDSQSTEEYLINPPQMVHVAFVPTQAQVLTLVRLPLTFTSLVDPTSDPTQTATCMASIWVAPLPTPTNCFGIQAFDSRTCSGLSPHLICLSASILLNERLVEARGGGGG